VKGKTLLASKRALGQAHCQAGTITRKYSRLRKGRVISERPALGTHLVSGAKVALVVSKGKKPRR
jgi:beta-lactam-binding protein with PASTA domain